MDRRWWIGFEEFGCTKMERRALDRTQGARTVGGATAKLDGPQRCRGTRPNFGGVLMMMMIMMTVFCDAARSLPTFQRCLLPRC
jgi:hypothetical protein